MSKRGRRTLIWMIVSLVLAGFGSFLGFTLLAAPAILTVAEAEVRARAASEMNGAVASALSGSDSASLVNILRDDNGKITMVQTDTLRINGLAAEAASQVQQRIEAMAESDAQVPAGTLVGGPLFSGTGPAIGVDIVPIAQCRAAFTPVFASAGINQTRMLLNVAVETKIELVVGGVCRSVELSVSVPACDILIVGDVPQTYLESARDEILNLVN